MIKQSTDKGVNRMKVFIVTKNGQPAHVTFCSDEAAQHFEAAEEAGDTTSLMEVAAEFANTSVLRRAKASA
jgi:hypothetical protein